VLVEHLRNETLVADRHDAPTSYGAGNPRRFLASMLECEQPEVREPSHVVLGGVDPEHSAFVAWAVAMIVRQRHL
jgi:hypothetical protein